jgi:hypothetical protein
MFSIPTKILCEFYHLPEPPTCPTHFILLSVSLVLCVEEYKLWGKKLL